MYQGADVTEKHKQDEFKLDWRRGNFNFDQNSRRNFYGSKV